jgi:type IV secretory pathway TrbL component
MEGIALTIVALVVVLVILLALYWAYDKCKLDKFLDPKYQKCGKQSGFVGSMAERPHLAPCAFSTANGRQLNRCNYV